MGVKVNGSLNVGMPHAVLDNPRRYPTAAVSIASAVDHTYELVYVVAMVRSVSHASISCETLSPEALASRLVTSGRPPGSCSTLRFPHGPHVHGMDRGSVGMPVGMINSAI